MSQILLLHHNRPQGQPLAGWQDTAADSPLSTVPARRGWDIHGAATAIQVATRSACLIRAWWRCTIARQREEQHLRVLTDYVRQEKAGVLLQAYARMWQARHRSHPGRCAQSHPPWCLWSTCRGCGHPASPRAGCSCPC
uniref:Uncharacterized protein n=1 Tax=Amazona collaria TaxID=241587 RepID=A0A8B9GRU8_9PSIT